MSKATGKKAVFLDRDGVLTEPVWNPATGEGEAAKRAEEVRLTSRAVEAVKRLRAAGYLAVVVSNQPDVAKGKATAEALAAAEREFEAQLERAGARLDGVYYCHHHPAGVVPELKVACECRKPAPGLVRRACAELGVDAGRSWFVGDRDTDVECGRAAGCRTILVRSVEAGRPGWGTSKPEHVAEDVLEAVRIIVEPVPWKS